jgi:DNA polymerase I
MEITPISRLPRLEGSRITIDTEGDGTHYIRNRPFLLGLIMDTGKRYAARWTPELARWLNDQLPSIRLLVSHNAKFDLHQFIQGGVRRSVLDGLPIHCTMVAEAVLDEHQREFDLDSLGMRHFGLQKESQELFQWLADNIGGKPDSSQMKNIKLAPIEMVADYCVHDTHIADRLYGDRQEELIKAQGLEQIMQLEMAVTRALIDIERRGIPVDVDRIPRAQKQLEKQLAVVSARIQQAAGFEVNVLSQAQLIRAFEAADLPIPIGDEGRPSFAKAMIKDIPHLMCRDILQSRTLRKGVDTFINSIYEYTVDGILYTNFHQLRSDEGGVITGRLSSSHPNMQQAPKRDRELGAIIRSLFRSPLRWISGDWEQFEFRIFAHYSGDDNLIKTYRKDPTTDFHQAVADMTHVPRNPFAKQINLGLVFGMGEGKLAQQLGLPYTKEVGRGDKVFLRPGPEAQQIFNTYHGRFPGAKKILQRAANLARERGYVKTIFGRKLRFPIKHQTYKAGGLVFQGTAADLMKWKLVELNRELPSVGGSLILSVHDEFDALAESGQEREVKSTMKRIMEDIPQLSVPILADVKDGKDWWSACK